MKERGSATILGLSLMLVILGVGLAVVAATQLVTARTRAVLAADAAALAAAPMTFPPLAETTANAAAATFAHANGAELVSCACPTVAEFEPRSVEVEVKVRTKIILAGEVEVRATSRAEFVP